ncbi:hypothetical protein H7J88_26105 [Mycolicibacterium flavescens]|uniref:Uncharacterized protein n=1 Tax=Mycolicibacterium flavescens TaxID=1776 RepID=A0A1E3RH03_MYCFV|nr:hypothetical protein [Mycolicibacterium flavescens]MCV7283112.1 hypothetical protein [Mycolicibacterium flavescens]ODQ89156.1 hypothetical protein BHQ18_16330 [Mycolicibacterium flavescens]
MQPTPELPDEVPVADAVEQLRERSEAPIDEEAAAGPSDNPPLEVSPADWQEQLETVELDPDDDLPDD